MPCTSAHIPPAVVATHKRIIFIVASVHNPLIITVAHELPIVAVPYELNLLLHAPVPVCRSFPKYVIYCSYLDTLKLIFSVYSVLVIAASLSKYPSTPDACLLAPHVARTVAVDEAESTSPRKCKTKKGSKLKVRSLRYTSRPSWRSALSIYNGQEVVKQCLKISRGACIHRRDREREGAKGFPARLDFRRARVSSVL